MVRTIQPPVVNQTSISSGELSGLCETSVFDFTHDELAMVSYLRPANPSCIVISTDPCVDALLIDTQGDVAISSSLRVDGDCAVSSSLIANQIESTGDIVTENLQATKMVTSDVLIAKSAIVSDKSIDSDTVNTNHLSVCKTATSPVLNTRLITALSNSDLVLNAQPNFSVTGSNYRYNIDESDQGFITAAQMKHSKVFIVTRMTYLEPDPSCDGIEIVVVNSMRTTVVLRMQDANFEGGTDCKQNGYVVKKLEAMQSIRLLYITCGNRWV